MQVFVQVAQIGSFGRAADLMQRPRSTVSATIKTLEHRLGTRLFNRTTRSVSLTADGESYLAQCEPILAKLDQIDSQFLGESGELQGSLRVDVPARIARTHVVPNLPSLFARHPKLQLILGATDRPVDLAQDAVDCAIRVGELEDSRLVARPLGDLIIGSFASPDYLQTYGVPTQPDDLSRHRMVAYASPSTGKAYQWEYRDQGKERLIAVPHVLTVNNADAYIAAAVAGLGMIQLPAYDVQEQLEQGRLCEILAEFRPPSVPLCALYPHRHQSSRSVRTFVDWFSTIFSQQFD